MQFQGEESVLAPQAVPLPEGEGWFGAGPGWDRYSPALLQRLGAKISDWRADQLPHARDVAVLAAAAYAQGAALTAEQALPVYIRDDVAVKSKVSA